MIDYRVMHCKLADILAKLPCMLLCLAFADIMLSQMFYDDLPIWGFIGKTEKLMKPGEKPALRFYLFTHIHFDILYNGNRVIEVNVSTDPARTVDITNGDKIIVDYTYSVNWRESPIPYEKRMEKYSRYSFLPQHLEASSHSAHSACNHAASGAANAVPCLPASWRGLTLGLPCRSTGSASSIPA